MSAFLDFAHLPPDFWSHPFLRTFQSWKSSIFGTSCKCKGRNKHWYVWVLWQWFLCRIVLKDVPWQKKNLQSASFLSLPVPWLQVFCSQASSLHWRGDLGHRGWTNSHCKQPSPDFYQMQKREASTGVTITSNRKKILTWTNSRPSGPPWLYTIPAMTTGQMPGKSGDIYRGK